MNSFALPDLGEGLQEAEIVSWHVAEGDHVVADQPLLSVETEKAVVEIPSPHAGHVARLLAKVGERVKVGAAVLEFEEGPHSEAGTVVGQLTLPPPAGVVTTPQAPPPPGPGAAGVRASPAVRSRARELGVDLAALRPTGPGDTITVADVEAAATALPSSRDNNALRGARRTMALNMAKAWREVVHATVQDEADIGAWRADEDVTVRMVRALIAGCGAEPSLNASFDAATLTLHNNAAIDLGIAIDSPDGLFVPVLRDVARGKREDWRRQIDECEHGVRARSLAPVDLRGATISLSNFGAIGGRHASLIVMPPQVAIVGVGRIYTRPIQRSGGISFGGALPLSLTFDHRAINGGAATRFLRTVIADLEATT